MAKSNTKSPLIIVILVCAAIGSSLYLGYVPPALLEQLPPNIQEILKNFISTENKSQSTPSQTQRPRTTTSDDSISELGNTSIQSFSKSKRKLLEMHLSNKRLATFYCGSEFDAQKQISHANSGYKAATSDANREKRVEWEHVVPAYKFGITFPYWTQRGESKHPDCTDDKGKLMGNRDCTEKNSLQYRYMQADLHNLRPAIGSVNGLRSNYDYAMIAGEERQFGRCDMEIDSKNKVAEPPEQVRGDIGRTYLYMVAAYPNVKFLNADEIKMMQTWANADPVTAWECQRERLIADIQGNRNEAVKKACEQAKL